MARTMASGHDLARIAARIAGSAAAITVVTSAIFVFREGVPVLSLGVLYLFAVLPVAILWGLAYAIPVAVASMAVFNWLFLHPVHTFGLADRENWFALAVYVVTAVVVSELAARAKRRAAEAERLAREALEAEDLRRSDAVKTTVLRSVSHDLRSPLTAIRVAAEGLLSPTLDLTTEDRAALLAAIQTETTRLQRVVDDLLDLSRLQAGVAMPDPDVWTLDELLSQALDGLSGGVERVEVDMPDGSPAVRVDAVQVERVLVNLLENALRFSPPDAVVRVRVRRSGDEVTLHVLDDGPGVPAEEAERVFQPFIGDGRGNGLGLAIARGFAEANGGRIWTEFRREGGATFALALPAVETPMAIRA